MNSAWNGKEWEHMNGKQKTVRMDAETIEIIEGYHGRDFSKKLRNLVKDFARQNQENVRQNQEGGSRSE